ncbi:MAG TPA: 50S ribosomal protein L11 methyltransferase [Syntrophomonadaceae bacterium]|jgi:ribosomal protein L11 methyltransferase|nr:50S ribosomal protein L11 methyltransferase [Syntrophomonadaceae bacterium]
MNWKEFSVLTEGICVEAIAGIFHSMGSGGVIIEDPQAARKYISEKWTPESVSEDFLNHEFVVVKAYFPEDNDVFEAFSKSIAAVEDNFQVKCSVFIDDVRNEDWEENWKKYYHAFKVGERLVIKPSWEEYHGSEGEVIVNIDPGMAFGTGIHASTRFCLRFLDQYVHGGENVIDAGCGSGILSIAAIKLGAAGVFAMDIDELAVRIARENIDLNGLADKILVQAGDIVTEIRGRQADMVLANITAEVVVELIPEAAKVIKSGGYFFGSGIVDSRWPSVQTALENNGFVVEQVLQDVDWIGVAARRR